MQPEPQGIPKLSRDWQARALALTLAAGGLGKWNIDMSRHARERLDPADYARFSYFEKWISALADLLVETGVLEREALSGAHPANPHPLAAKVLKAADVPAVIARGGPTERAEGPLPLFAVGAGVRVSRPSGNTLVEGGHTRLPAYVAGARGTVIRCHGNHVLPDSNAHGLAEAPEPLYAVAFLAPELWTHSDNPRDEVVLDLWQSYLEAAE